MSYFNIPYVTFNENLEYELKIYDIEYEKAINQLKLQLINDAVQENLDFGLTDAKDISGLMNIC